MSTTTTPGLLTESPEKALSRVEFEMATLGYRTDARQDNQSDSRMVMSAKMRNGFWGWFWTIVTILFTLGLGLVLLVIQSFMRVRVTIRAVEESGGTQMYFEGNAQGVKDARRVEARSRP